MHVKGNLVTHRKWASQKWGPWLGSRRLIIGFSPWRHGFYLRSVPVGFVVDKVTLEQAFTKYFCIICQFSFHKLLHFTHLSFGTGTVGRLRPDTKRLSLFHHRNLKKNQWMEDWASSALSEVYSSKDGESYEDFAAREIQKHEQILSQFWKEVDGVERL
jgi:hypothetical protein